MNSPEAYIQFKQGLIDDEGRVSEPSTEEFLRKYMEDFHAFVVRVYTALPRSEQ
jgi:chromate reductase